MLDRRFIRDNPEAVKAAVRVKGIGLDVDELLSLDQSSRELQRELDEAQGKRKSFAKEFARADEETRAKLRAEHDEQDLHLRGVRDQLGKINEELQALLLLTPTIPWEGAPVGPDDTANVTIKTWGEKPVFDFDPKDHVELLEYRGWAEFARARKVSGERAYALTGDMVLLERALLSYALDHLISVGSTVISVPALVRDEALFGTGQFPAHREETYAVTADDLYLAGTAEVALVGLHAGEILDAKALPIRYAGISPCFRREAGSAGRDVRGLLRVHQFEKVEQFVICAADNEESDRWHFELLGAAEHLLQGLGLAYEIVECSTGDMGAGKYRMNDINTWFPSLERYRETHSCSSLHDWQARRASVRYRDTDGTVKFAFTLNNTAIATPRLLAALVENYQTAEQTVRVPQVLQPYLGGRTELLSPGGTTPVPPDVSLVGPDGKIGHRIGSAQRDDNKADTFETGGRCAVGRDRRTLRGVELQADRVAELAGRPVAQLRRRDVAIALLSVPAGDALASLPAIRRGLLAAGNPLSAPFWNSAEAILHKIGEHTATFGDVHGWLEATGTEPTGIIGLHVWEEPSARSPLQEEMHSRLVGYLEERLAAGEIDPDRLATGDEAARRDYLALQERWMTSQLPDGRVPMTVLLDEQDEVFLADWAAADAEARDALRSVLDTVGERPLPAADLRSATARLRADIARPGWPGQMLISFSGRTAQGLPADDSELWLTLATSVASPQGDPLSDEDKEFARAMEWAEDADLEFGDLGEFGNEDDGPDEMSAAIAAVSALDHFDWLAVMSALVTGGPGTPASAADLARYVRDFDPDQIAGLGDHEGAPAEEAAVAEDVEEYEFAPGADADYDAPSFDDFDDDFDELSVEGLFLHVTAMWSVLGAIDEDDRLTRLGWWGLPEAMRRAWTD